MLSSSHMGRSLWIQARCLFVFPRRRSPDGGVIRAPNAAKRVSLSLMGLASAASLGCADAPRERDVARPAIAQRADAVQRGTVVAPSAALSGGFVLVEPFDAAATKVDARTCSGTVIGPRLILTAEHCVRQHDEETDAWEKLKTSITVSAPGATGWKVSNCQISPLKDSGELDIPSKPKVQVLRPFGLGLAVLPKLQVRPMIAAAVPPLCGVATLGSPPGSPHPDVAVIRLPSSAPAFPGWPTSTVIEGGSIDGYVDKKKRTICVGYGQDQRRKPGESLSGIAKEGLVELTSKIVAPGAGFVPIPSHGVGLRPFHATATAAAGEPWG